MSYDGTLKFDTKIDSSGFQKGISSISSIAKTGLQATTSALGIVAAGIGAIGTFAIKAGSDFESSMSNVAAIAGLTSKEAGSDYDILVKKAKEVASQSKFTAAETADALSYMAMAGWKTEDMTAALSSVVNLAAASGQDLASTSDILTDAITALGHTASDSTGIIDEYGNEVSYATHFADILAAASSNANTNVGMLGESFKYAAPVAGALGITAEDTSIALGLMANAGIKASQGGTALRTGLSNLVKPTKQMQTYMDKYNIALVKNADGSVNLRDTMKSLRERMGSLSTTEQAAAASAIFGKEAMSGWLAIINASDADFEKLTNAIDNCDGTTQQMADTMNDNLKGQLTMLQSQLDILGVSIYESLQTPMKGAVQTLREFADALQDAYNEGGMDALIGKSGEVLAGMVTALAQAAPQVVEVALSVARSFISSLLANKAEVASAGSELVTTLVTGIISFSGDLWSCGVELFAEFLRGMADNTPQIVTAAQNAIIQLGTSLAENAPSIASSAVQIISALAEGFMQVLPQLIDIGKQIIEGLIQGISEESPQLGAFFSGIFDGVQEVLGPAVDALKTVFEAVSSALASIDPATAHQIGEAIVKIATAILLFNGAKSVISTITGLVSSFLTLKGNVVTTFTAIRTALPGLMTSLSGIGTSLSGLASSAMAGISAFGSAVISGFGAVVAAIGVGPLIAIAAAIAAIIAVICNWDAVKEFFTSTLPAWWTGTAWPAITGLFNTVAQWFSELPGKISEFLSGVITALGEWVSGLLEWASAGIAPVIEAICSFFSQLPGRIWGFLVQTWSRLVTWGANMLTNATTIATNVITAICNFFAQLPGRIWNFLVQTWSRLVTWGANMLANATAIATNVLTSICNFFAQLPGRLAALLSQALQRLISWGSQMLSSARSAASNTINGICSFFSQLPGRIATFLSNVISRVASWGGQMAAAGRSAASQLVSAVVNGVASLPGRMASIGSNIVSGIVSGVSGAAGALYSTLSSLASNALSAAKSALGINSPSKVFRDTVGISIPEGISVGIHKGMPALRADTQRELNRYADEMFAAVNGETRKFKFSAGTSESYKAQRDNGAAFEQRETPVTVNGEIHTHVELDGKEVGNSTTPIVDRNLARIEQHKKRGG